jgi:L-cysteine S-thiosulfotransferase
MTRSKLLVAYWTAILVIPTVLFIGSIRGQVRQARAADVSARPAQPAPIRATMSDLHAHGGVPRGWKFLMPPGDAAEGRQVFVSLECFACHEVKGERFPQTSTTPRGAGPELTGMGGHHPAEYFAESIINPNRVIVQGEGYTGADGLSKMPSYADTMTIKQLVDVVAYLKSLTTGEMAHDHGHMSRSMTSGDSMKMK